MPNHSSWKVTKAVSQLISPVVNKNDVNPPIARPPAPGIEREVYRDRLKIFIGTWNMYGRLLPIDLSTFLTSKNNSMHNYHSTYLDGFATHPYHILVIGTQECERDISESLFYPSKEVWEKRLSDYLGSHYKLVKTETLAALHIAVFVWLPVQYLVRDVQSESIKTGWANVVGNKGAVAISVLFGSRSLLFINCHLRAHQTKLTERNANVTRILSELKIPNFKIGRNKKKKSYPSVIDQFDHVFLFGDTNYRINAERPFVFDAIKQGDYNSLLEYDQLSVERRTEGSPLSQFQEHPIQFPPTYKLDTMARAAPAPDTSESEHGHTPNSTSSLQRSTTKQSTSSIIILPPPSSKKKSVKHNLSRRLGSRKKINQRPEHQVYINQHEEKSSSESSIQVFPCDSKIALFENPSTILSYDSSEKQRVPSWTDRILWCDRTSTHHITPPPAVTKKKKLLSRKKKTTDQQQQRLSLFPFSKKRQFMRDTICYSYHAVLHESLFGVSDHMPVIGVFGVYFDEWSQQKKLLLKTIPTVDNTPIKVKAADRVSRWWWQRHFS